MLLHSFCSEVWHSMESHCDLETVNQVSCVCDDTVAPCFNRNIGRMREVLVGSALVVIFNNWKNMELNSLLQMSILCTALVSHGDQRSAV